MDNLDVDNMSTRKIPACLRAREAGRRRGGGEEAAARRRRGGSDAAERSMKAVTVAAMVHVVKYASTTQTACTWTARHG